MQNMHKFIYWHILHIYALPTLLMEPLCSGAQWKQVVGGGIGTDTLRTFDGPFPSGNLPLTSFKSLEVYRDPRTLY